MSTRNDMSFILELVHTGVEAGTDGAGRGGGGVCRRGDTTPTGAGAGISVCMHIETYVHNEQRKQHRRNHIHFSFHFHF